MFFVKREETTMNVTPMKIDVDKVLRERLPRHYRYIPRAVVRWLERVICQERLNVILKFLHKQVLFKW